MRICYRHRTRSRDDPRRLSICFATFSFAVSITVTPSHLNPQIFFVRLQSDTPWFNARFDLRNDFPRCRVYNRNLIDSRHADEQLRTIGVSTQSSPGLFSITSVSSLLPPKPRSGSITEMFASSIECKQVIGVEIYVRPRTQAALQGTIAPLPDTDPDPVVQAVHVARSRPRV